MVLSPSDFERLRAYIHQVSGIALGKDKLYLAEQRLEPLVRSTGCESFSEFTVRLVNTDSIQLRNDVILSITTNETCFFRDGHPFEAFENHILPWLGDLAGERKRKWRDRDTGAWIQILSIGASTGQEPYSIAMLAYEYAKRNRYLGVHEDDFGILGIDISRKVLEKAISGTYTEMEISRGLTPQMVSDYFVKTTGGWQIKDFIKKMVRYLHLNITDSSCLPGVLFDVIFCRNIMIYFDDQTKIRLFEKMHKMLSDRGYLILGSMENTYMLTDKFESVSIGSSILYRKKSNEIPNSK